jgi:asparagine synthase (glutamine-hydrolysing)
MSPTRSTRLQSTDSQKSPADSSQESAQASSQQQGEFSSNKIAQPADLPPSSGNQPVSDAVPSNIQASGNKTGTIQTDFFGQPPALIDRVVNLMAPDGNILLGTSWEDACTAVASGDAEAVGQIRGQFAICQQSGKTIRMARSIGRPMRYFLAKRAEGPALIIAERIDEIREQLDREGLSDQFNPAYTRMVPAHHILELQLVGCPDPNPKLTRYFAPPRNRLTADIDQIGQQYIGRFAEVCDAWLDQLADDAPIGVLFSGGIDSGSVVVVLDFLLRRRGQSSARLKAFTLNVVASVPVVSSGSDGTHQQKITQVSSSPDETTSHPTDAIQAREFLKSVNLEMIHEIIDVPLSQISWADAIKVIEDYKPLDVQSATMGLATLKEIRRRYPDWKYMIDGDGGDENLKDYPIEENPELTVRSVLGNRMLYQEGWGVDAVKHSLTYSGGQSRGHVRTSAPATQLGFSGFSPYATTEVIKIAEAIPFVELTNWDHEKLYQLKGQIVAAGVQAITGIEMPIYEKKRFQQGAASSQSFSQLFPAGDRPYRDKFAELFPTS